MTLVDNGGHIAKLATPFPGMESLRYIYIKIWYELNKSEACVIEKFNEKLEEKAKEIKNANLSEDDSQAEYKKFQQELNKSLLENIKEQIRASDFKEIDTLIPGHLRKYVQQKLDKWIDMAIHAKYYCHELQQYRIENKNGEKVVVPVDYLNTGITLRNTIWSDGLHQFVQLKHNLHLTFESLTSSFISNIGYIKKYGSKIFGLTGTLGSRVEQSLLSSIYKVDYAKIPTYKSKNFKELLGIFVEDSEWDQNLAVDLLEKVDEGRAVLVICETQKDLESIRNNLNILKQCNSETSFNIRVYANEDDVEETKAKVKSGDIILATNIAGRGTDFETDELLEQKGGLHVCVSFLPCNQRVEDQAFGRTSRQGKSGTAQLFIKESELEKLDIANLTDINFDKIKSIRNGIEKKRIKDIQDIQIVELDFKDTLFSYFADLYRDLKIKNQNKREFIFVLQDLKEYWAFWLEKRNFKGGTLNKEELAEEFENFKSDANTKDIIKGTIRHNPYYSIMQAELFLQNDKVNEAAIALKHDIELGKGNPEILYSAYIKLFDVAVESGGQLLERFKKAVANLNIA